MRRRFLTIVSLVVGSALGAVGAIAAPPERVEVPTLKTSIYVGSVTLSLSLFERAAEAYTATYDARVTPWFFSNESGKITLQVPDAELGRLLQGETIELSGEAKNHRGDRRGVTARIRPSSDATSGSIKVRVEAGGTLLIFNGSYRFADPPAAAAG